MPRPFKDIAGRIGKHFYLTKTVVEAFDKESKRLSALLNRQVSPSDIIIRIGRIKSFSSFVDALFKQDIEEKEVEDEYQYRMAMQKLLDGDKRIRGNGRMAMA